MSKTILLTGATDGLGLQTAKKLLAAGHTVLLHGRNSHKLQSLQNNMIENNPDYKLEIWCADLSILSEVYKLSESIKKKHSKLDVLINNAGVFKVANPISIDNLDVRFVVNSIAPYILTTQLCSLFSVKGRIVNVASAAQAPVTPETLNNLSNASDANIYAQSKLALIMWTRAMAESNTGQGPLLVSVNPKSLLGSKMVKEAYGIDGSSLDVGADILLRAALSPEFENANGKYFDNDIEAFASPHPFAQNAHNCNALYAHLQKLYNR